MTFIELRENKAYFRDVEFIIITISHFKCLEALVTTNDVIGIEL